MNLSCSTCKGPGDKVYVNCLGCRRLIDNLEYRLNFDKEIKFRKDESPVHKWMWGNQEKSISVFLPTKPSFIRIKECRVYVRESRFGEQISVSVDETEKMKQLVSFLDEIAEINFSDFKTFTSASYRIHLNSCLFVGNVKKTILELKNFPEEQTLILVPVLQETKKGTSLKLLVREYYPSSQNRHKRR